MYLKTLQLQNFRSYTRSSFTFSEGTTIIIGPNTAGKTNLIEAVYLLATGKSFRAEKDVEAIQFQKEMARVKGLVDDNQLEVVLTTGEVAGITSALKKYLLNGVAKRRADFAGNLIAVLFSPLDLEIIIDSPSIRRSFLDDAISQVDREYARSLLTYTKALRQRNALLQLAKEKGIRNDRQFAYWDELLIGAGNTITKKREEFIIFLNNSQKEVFDLIVIYDKSTISKERLLQYKDAEVGSGVTLVGPHRDDFNVNLQFKTENLKPETRDIKLFGSRGQQRLAVLQLKMLQLLFVEQATGKRPLLLLDDIFSELDEGHINLIWEIIPKQQAIITTTHEEFVKEKLINEANVIELG